jgi:hypothetical protein
MTQIDILTGKLDSLTDGQKGILRYILAHGAPQRSELFEGLKADFTAGEIDAAVYRAQSEGLIALDPATYRYSVVPHFKEGLAGLL